MTRRELSDAQLDAMAAGRANDGDTWYRPDGTAVPHQPGFGYRPIASPPPPKAPALPVGSLLYRIAKLQHDYRREAIIPRLTAMTPPVMRQVVEYEEGRYEVVTEPTYGIQVGMPLSGPMLGLIGDLPKGYGPHQPVRTALTSWERRCRRSHRQVPGRAPMWVDHAIGPICAEMAWSVIKDRTSIEFAADQAKVDFPRGERLIEQAVDYIERLTERASEPPQAGHDRDGCPICRAA